MMKSPSVNENVNTDPAAMPGTASGNTTLRNVCEGRAPRSAEACSNEPGTRSSAAAMGRIMNGSHMYTNTKNMPRYEDDIDGPPIPGVASMASNKPESPSLAHSQGKMPSFASSRRQA